MPTNDDVEVEDEGIVILSSGTSIVGTTNSPSLNSLFAVVLASVEEEEAEIDSAAARPVTGALVKAL